MKGLVCEEFSWDPQRANRCSTRDVLQDRRVLISVGGGHAAFRLVHASQLSSALQMTLRRGPRSVRLNPASINTSEALTFPHLSESQRSQLVTHGDRDFTEATRSMWSWDKLGGMELYAMDQIQVNILLLLLLVAVKSKPCLWREDSVCGYEACSQPCAVSTVQSARPLDSRPWGYRLLKWSSVPSITSLYYLRIQEKGNKLFIEPFRASCRALGKGNYCDISQSIQYTKHFC